MKRSYTFASMIWPSSQYDLTLSYFWHDPFKHNGIRICYNFFNSIYRVWCLLGEQTQQLSSEMLDLNRVIESAINTMQSSKEQIFEIAEYAKAEEENIRRDLQLITKEVQDVIELYDHYELEYRKKRNKLMQVSRNFNEYSEEDIREAYDEAYKIQIELRVTGEREQYLKKRRDELYIRLKNLEMTIDRADVLIGQVGVVLNYLQGDISRIGDELKEAKDGQEFGLRIIEAQEEERRRVSREIHDGPAQSMANVVMRAELADRMISQGHIDDAKIELRNLKQAVRNSLADVRRIIYDLRPMALDDLGLIPALRRFVEAYSDTPKQFEIHFQFTGIEVRLPTSFEVAIYRLVQESMNNISKHANAKHVEIKVDFSPDMTEIIVADDGIGFADDASDQEKKFGLLGMRERVKLLAGELKIDSAPGKGTTITISIPMPKEERTENKL